MIQDAIRRAAEEAGIDPATALAIAQRESSFNPNARSSKTIHGLFQMRGDLRRQYGIGDSTDPYAQAKGWGAHFKDTKATMGRSLGRDVTDAEGYAGHHFGASRAARMLNMEPDTPVSHVFTPYERSINPHFDKAGTVGNLLSSVTSDIDRRSASFGGKPSMLEAGPAGDLDFSAFGDPADTQPQPSSTQTASAALDFSQFGTPVS